MNLLLFSDNHRDREAVDLILKANPNCDHYISLGDSEMREHELTERNIFGVKGNYPFEPKFPYDLTFFFEGVKVFLTHGHHYSVKLGLSKLLNKAVYNDIEIVCFGHTHRAMIKDINGILFINPGALSQNKIFSEPTYAILDITNQKIQVVIKSITGEVLEQYQKKRDLNELRRTI